MTEPNECSVMRTSFRDRISNDYYVDLIAEQLFWTPEDFSNADHHIIGDIDEFGQFNGIVKVYGKEFEHVVPWTEGHGRTQCGPFKVKVAYVQGKLKQSSLDAEEHARMIAKLDKIGGLYIYRDNIRILPYGDSDYDFLDIEKRRNLSAGYYFFSYRRIFGTIEITRQYNQNLIEKAGREGFIQNKAYTEIKKILENLFVQLAADFFRVGKEEEETFDYTEYYKVKRDELVRLHLAKEQQEKKARARRKKFSDDLERFFEKMNSKEPDEKVEQLLKETKNELAGAQDSIEDPSMFVKSVLRIEKDALKSLENIKSEYTVIKPRGTGLSKQTARDWNLYQHLYRQLGETTFLKAEKEMSEMISEIGAEHAILLDKQLRFNEALSVKFSNTKQLSFKESRETKEKITEVTNQVSELIQELNREISKNIQQIQSEVARIDISKLDDVELIKQKEIYESKISEEFENAQRLMWDIRAQLDSITWTKTEDGAYVTSMDEREALENELLTLREQIELDLELSQLGTAVSIIHHEFTNTITSIRRSMVRLKSWADFNEELVPLYRDVKNNFEQLDGYLTLFTPLNRRLYRKKVDLTGKEIAKYVHDVFKERLRRHDIKLSLKSAFLKKTIQCYPSTLLPAIINVVDNAIFWLGRSPGPREISLDADEEALFISNNGEPLLSTDILTGFIFEQGFTRKPGGRGMGLYISKEVLKREGFDITVSEAKPSMRVTFKISIKIEDGENA
jgi:signal transduction histidine kinase